MAVITDLIFKRRDGITTDYINYDHYLRVRRARKKRGYDDGDKTNVRIAHHLVGKYIYSKKRQRWYLIEGVNRQWYGGFYLGMLIQNSGSHTFIYFENINSISDCICEIIEDTKKEFDWEDIRTEVNNEN